MGTMPSSNVPCILSQHIFVRVVLWGLPFCISQHRFKHCADNFILLAVLLLPCSRLAWVFLSDFLFCIDGPSLDWFALRAGAVWEAGLNRSLIFFPPAFLVHELKITLFKLLWKFRHKGCYIKVCVFKWNSLHGNGGGDRIVLSSWTVSK